MKSNCSIAGIILSAGASSRMGTPKALLKFQGETFLDRLIRLFSEAGVAPTVVLGHHADQIRAGIKRASDATFVVNPDPTRGMLSSLQCALAAIPKQTEAVMFLPVDHPNLESGTLRKLIDNFSPPITVPTFQEKHGHPVVIARALIPELLALPVTAQASDVIRRYRTQTTYIAVDDAAVTTDIDDPASYGALISNHQRETRNEKRETRTGSAMKHLRRAIYVILAFLIVIAFASRFLRADRLRPRIQRALETALNRPVHLTSGVHVNFFTGLGFTVDDVLIDDDPAAGAEPFAHVESLRARIQLTSLFRGKLAFSSIYLDSPSVNLVKMANGAWNIQPLLEHSPATNAPHQHAVPDIKIRDGRLNLKFGDVKSVFFISGADVDIYPNENGDVVIRFSGAPARTDRGSLGLGQLSARGMLRSGANGEDVLNMGLRLERTAILEVARLFNGRDLGVHGFAVANAHLAGPLSKIEVNGDLNITDIHRWDLMPPKGEGWILNYRGELNMPGHHLELETVEQPEHPSPVSVKLRLADYQAAPKWAASIMFRDLPAAPLVETARHMGAPFPPGVQVEGKVQGGIGYSNDGGLQGKLELTNASMKIPDAVSAEFPTAAILFANDKISFGPAEIQMENGQSAEIEGEYALDNSHAALKFSSRQLTIAEVQSRAGQVVSAPPIPLLEKLRQGTWKGWIAFDRTGDHPGVWSGEYDLQNASIDIPGVAAPLRFTSASVEMKNSGIHIDRIRAHVGQLKLEGDYRYDPDAGRPHRIKLHAAEVQLSEIERLMLPTLRRNESFLARTFRLRKETLPPWLQQREVDGEIRVDRLLNGDSPVGAFRAHLIWDGPSLVFSNADCKLGDMHASGKITLNVDQRAPAYHLAGTIENLDYRNGQLDVDGELDTSGLAENLILNIRSEGTFEGRDIELGPDATMHEISGSYRVGTTYGLPRLTLSNLQVVQGADNLSGQGASQPDGHIVLDLTTGRKQIRLTGMLLPMHPEAARP